MDRKKNAEALPLQPLYRDREGVIRFRENAIVRALVDRGIISLNTLGEMEFSAEDREQFAQLLGYSLTGFGELSYVSDATYKRAAEEAKKLATPGRT